MLDVFIEADRGKDVQLQVVGRKTRDQNNTDNVELFAKETITFAVINIELSYVSLSLKSDSKWSSQLEARPIMVTPYAFGEMRFRPHSVIRAFG